MEGLLSTRPTPSSFDYIVNLHFYIITRFLGGDKKFGMTSLDLVMIDKWIITHWWE